MNTVLCIECNKEFFKKPTEQKRRPNHFCSQECHKKFQRKNKLITSLLNCEQCGIAFLKRPSEQKKTKNHFCSQSCAATYNNTHKKYGTRVSKLEVYLQEKLKELYEYDFHFNRKDTINSELDIYIPELKLAFELNGVFHYEPIFGEEKLNQIQNNDDRKFQACLEQQISLCIIDTSWIKYNKVSNFNKILDIIKNVISKSGQKN